MLHVCQKALSWTSGELGTMKQVRGPGCGQGCWADTQLGSADRRAVLVLEGSASVHVLVKLENVVLNLESVVCVGGLRF